MVEAVEHVQVTQIVHRTQQNKLDKLQMCASQFNTIRRVDTSFPCHVMSHPLLDMGRFPSSHNLKMLGSEGFRQVRPCELNWLDMRPLERRVAWLEEVCDRSGWPVVS